MLVDNGLPPRISRIEDPGWATMWQKRFEPFPVGDRMIIVPPWKRAPVDGRLQIVIRPGQAFGTGHHASTYSVLNLVEQLFESEHFARVLDVGTGSGILAIAMRKLGAAHVTAIDLDSIALDNARENMELNRVAGAIRCSVAPLNLIRGRFDLITANILSSILIEMAPLLKARLRPGGYLILAGILAREAKKVAAAYVPELRRVRTRADGAWRALLFQR
jgi:ribosomal protein L11 methyltransferase